MYNSFARPHLECAVQFWTLHQAKDIAKLGVQRRAYKIIPHSPQKRQPRGKLTECFEMVDGFTNVDPTKLFVRDDSTPTRDNGAKPKCRQVHSDCTKMFFSNALVRDWNKLPPSVSQWDSIVSFKNNLDRRLLHLNVHCVTFSVMAARHDCHLG